MTSSIVPYPDHIRNTDQNYPCESFFLAPPGSVLVPRVRVIGLHRKLRIIGVTNFSIAKFLFYRVPYV
jgi:hypothetical protein